MKKTLSLLGILSVLAFSAQTSQAAFEWGYLNPANWGNSSCKCQKQKCKSDKCSEHKKAKACKPQCDEPCPCPAAPITPQPCDPCDTLQDQMQYQNNIR